MPKIFTEMNRAVLKLQLLDDGFEMLKSGGLSAVNIDKLTEKAYIAKGTFYNIFPSKSEYMYQMMIHERNRAKNKLESFLNDTGKLSRDSLREYLLWLAAENPNVFAYITDAEKKRLLLAWKDNYIEDEDNDHKTMQMLISLLAKPSPNPDWQLACNYMKLIAISLATKKVFIESGFDWLINSLVDNIVHILCG